MSSQDGKMISKPLQKSKFAMKFIAYVASLLMVSLILVVSAVEDTVPHRTSADLYLDPCKAAGFWGDIALSDAEYRATKKMLLNQMKNSKDQTSLMELQVDDPGTHSNTDAIGHYKNREEYKRQLQTDRNYLKKILKEKVATLKSPCEQQNKKLCRLEKADLREEIKRVREKWRRLKLQIRRLKEQDFERKNIMRKFQLADKHSSKSNTTKQTVPAKQKGLNSKYNFAQKKKTEPTKAPTRKRRAATARKDRLWDYGVIPYMIDANFSGSNKALFKLAMRHWENYTCITFKEKENEDQHYILFTERSCGCCSFVGKRGNGPQAISIGKNCDKFGIVVHELGHVIGFWHEHTRPDRDHHVQIIYKNIMPGQEYNFNKLTAADVNSLGETYDFGSIMHYSRNTFARNTYLDTILPQRKPGTIVRPEIGQRIRLSPGDIRQANKLYRCPSCGRTLQESIDKFSHTSKPGVPDFCQWRISATHGEKIVLNITHVDMPKSYNCESDYLEVRDGHYIKSPLLGRYCGDQIPDTLTSTGTRMWIEYRTRNGGGHGFAAAYEAMCGGEIMKEEGFLTSPNYPDDYRPQKKCVWRITVGEEFTVALKFQSFEIENHKDCVYDYLEVHDGPTEASPLFGKYCGFKIPEDIKSTGNHLYVKFVSDGSVQKAGFSASFVKEFDECSRDDHGCDHECVNTLGSYRCSCRIGYELHSDGRRCEDACGGYIDYENGTITSPSFPDLYPPNKNCVWQIVAPDGHQININFTHFDLEGHNQDCEYDSVRVSSGVGGNDLKPLGVFCGSTFPAPVTSEGSSLRIEFNSDNSVQKTGFVATFTTAVIQKHGRLLHKTDLDVVVLKHGGFAYQLVEVALAEKQGQARQNGVTNPTSNKDECALDNGGCQHICRNTVGSYQCACHNGFTLHDDMHGCKEGGCQFEIRAHSGAISSPNYPEYYPSRKDCVWHFTTVPGHRIRLRFRVFELEPHQECTYDHVVVFDGDDSSARSLGKFCGALVPDPVTSSGNRMFMLFFSDASVQRKGFEAEHSTVCGAHLIATASAQGLVSHARYGDNNYDNREDCEWKIQAKEGRRVQLKFTAFDLEDEAECGYDVVTVYDGLQDSDLRIGEFCGSEIPDPITSSTEYLLIRFRSDDTINWKGFSATYQLATSSPDYVEGKDIYDLEMDLD